MISTPETPVNESIILFDGLCNLCNRSVQFILKRDAAHQFRFASLQSAYGQALLAKNQLSATDLNSFILYQNGRIYTRSTGALRVTRKLKAPWHLLSALLIVPGFIRDGVYKWVSKNRYRWFGKKSECWLPSPAFKDRFIQ